MREVSIKREQGFRLREQEKHARHLAERRKIDELHRWQCEQEKRYTVILAQRQARIQQEAQELAVMNAQRHKSVHDQIRSSEERMKESLRQQVEERSVLETRIRWVVACLSVRVGGHL